MSDMTFRLFGQDVSASKALQKVGREADNTGKDLAKHIGAGTIAAGAALGSLVTGGLTAVIGGFGDLITAARQAAAASRITAQVIKTTGGAANVTSKDVDELAMSISNKTGIDEDAIHASENLLLTFTDVRNEVGKGNDIFNQATQAVTDMSAALGQDGKSSAIQLGKALNDPIKGLTALSRVGVSFTAQQKEQIKTLIEHNDKLGAQKIILKELGKEFGGAAAASSDPMQKLGVILRNLGKQLASNLLPFLGAAASWIADNLVPAVRAAASWVQSTLIPAIKHLAEWLGQKLGPIIRDIAKWVGGTFIPAMKNLAGIFMNTVLPAIMGVFTFLNDHKEVLVGIGAAVLAFVIPAIIGWVVATWDLVVADVALGIAMLASYAPIIAVALLIGALVASVVYAYKHFTVFRNVVNTVFAAIKTAIGAVVGWFVSYVWPLLKLYIGLWVIYFKILWGAVQLIFAGIKAVIGAVVGWFMGTAWPIIRTVIGYIIGYYKTLWSVASDIWGKVQGAVQTFLTFFNTKVVPIVRSVAGAIGSIFSSVANAAETAFSAIKGFINQYIIDPVNAVINGLNGINIPGVTSTNIPKIPQLAAGGIVTSPTIAMIGEAGPEAVIPLSKMNGIGGGITVNVNIPVGFVGNEQQLATAIVSTLQRYKGRGGKLGLG